jgi:hypothetical protein
LTRTQASFPKMWQFAVVPATLANANDQRYFSTRRWWSAVALALLLLAKPFSDCCPAMVTFILNAVMSVALRQCSMYLERWYQQQIHVHLGTSLENIEGLAFPWFCALPGGSFESASPLRPLRPAIWLHLVMFTSPLIWWMYTLPHRNILCMLHGTSMLAWFLLTLGFNVLAFRIRMVFIIDRACAAERTRRALLIEHRVPASRGRIEFPPNSTACRFPLPNEAPINTILS